MDAFNFPTTTAAMTHQDILTDHARYMRSLGYGTDEAERDAATIRYVAGRIVSAAKSAHAMLPLSDCYDPDPRNTLATMAECMAEIAADNLNKVGAALLLSFVAIEVATIELQTKKEAA